MSDSFIICSGLSFSWPDDTPVFRDLTFTVPGGRTGLVGPNGAGKTTLLRLIAGELCPAAGSVTIEGTLGHLPQNLPLAEGLSVLDVLGIGEVVRALRAVESGDAAEEHFTTIGPNWDIEERTRAQLDRLGLGELDFDRPLPSLSGGQIVSLGLAAQLVRHPDVLLLDEPTNNLDVDARHRLYTVLDEWRGCLLVVSHDRALLDRLDRIAELHASEVRFFGGNFTAYEETVAAAREATDRDVRHAEQEVKREKREMQRARERAARRSSTATRNLGNAGLPKIFAGTMKRNAEESAAKVDGTQASRLSAARARLEEAELAHRDDEKIALSLPQTTVPHGRILFHGEGLRIRRGERELFAEGGITLDIRGPERIALTGANGAGKSTLLRIVRGELEPDSGTVSRVDGRIAYLSQRLDLLEDHRTVAQSLSAAAPHLAPSDRMNLLARFLFRGQRVHLPVGALSGGERLRATLVCILFTDPAPQLLLLDEPTNNLDLVSAGQLESALAAYRGGLVVVSHDERFLAELRIDRTLRLDGGRLREGGRT